MGKVLELPKTGAFTPEQFEALTPIQKRYLQQRESLLRAAIEDLLIDGRRVRQAMQKGDGIWYDSLAPLTAQERTLVLQEVKKILGVVEGK